MPSICFKAVEWSNRSASIPSLGLATEVTVLSAPGQANYCDLLSTYLSKALYGIVLSQWITLCLSSYIPCGMTFTRRQSSSQIASRFPVACSLLARIWWSAGVSLTRNSRTSARNWIAFRTRCTCSPCSIRPRLRKPAPQRLPEPLFAELANYDQPSYNQPSHDQPSYNDLNPGCSLRHFSAPEMLGNSVRSPRGR
jgi:hypothetical protein